MVLKLFRNIPLKRRRTSVRNYRKVNSQTSQNVKEKNVVNMIQRRNVYCVILLSICDINQRLFCNYFLGVSTHRTQRITKIERS